MECIEVNSFIKRLKIMRQMRLMGRATSFSAIANEKGKTTYIIWYFPTK